MDKTPRELNEEELSEVAGGSSLSEESYCVNPDLCVACGACADVCPTGCIAVHGDHAVIDQEYCIQCGSCESECPVGAICKR